jgi:hypothetical protein
VGGGSGALEEGEGEERGGPRRGEGGKRKREKNQKLIFSKHSIQRQVINIQFNKTGGESYH